MAQDRVVQLNVGGSLYTASRSVLAKYVGSKLHDMCSGNESTTMFDEKGRVFIDRDGKLFRYILNFVRDDNLIVPLKFAEFDLLLAEAEYYQLQQLKQAIREKLISNVHMMEYVKLKCHPANQAFNVEATKTTAFTLYNRFGKRIQWDPNVIAPDVISFMHRDQSLQSEIENFLIVLGFSTQPATNMLYRYR